MSPFIRAWILLLASLLTTLFALHTGCATQTSRFTKDPDIKLYQQVVELETPRNEQAVLDLLRHGDPKVEPLQRQQYWVGLDLDNIFLVLYPLQLVALVIFAWRTEAQGTTKALLAFSALTIIAGGICDWEENHQISRLLSDYLSLPLIDATRRWSLAKWALVGIAYLSAAAGLHAYIKGPPNKAKPELLPMGPWRPRIIIIALLLAGISSIWGASSFLWQGDFRRLLETSVYCAAIAVLACATLWPHRQSRSILNESHSKPPAT
jgi:hypothetical protein